MIQRTQNFYLLTVIIMLGWFLLSDIPKSSGSDWQMFLIYGLGLSALGLTVVCLAHYKDRNRQRRFVTVALADMVVFAAVVYASLYFSGTLTLQSNEGMDYVRLSALFMPAAAYLGTRLALMGIRRDIRLVQSPDRLR